MTPSPSSVPDYQVLIREWLNDTAEHHVFIMGIVDDGDARIQLTEIGRQFTRSTWGVLQLQDAWNMFDPEDRIQCRRYIPFIKDAITYADMVLVYNVEDSKPEPVYVGLGIAAATPTTLVTTFGQTPGYWRYIADGHFSTPGDLQSLLDSYSRMGDIGSRSTKLRAALRKFSIQ